MPKSAKRRIDEYNVEDEFGAKDCTLESELKLDHNNRPLWIVILKLLFQNNNLILFIFILFKTNKNSIHLLQP